MNKHFTGSALVIHCARFVHRLRRHGIEATIAAFVDDGRTCCKVIVGRRKVNVFNDGACTRSLQLTNDHFDHPAFIAQSHRMHAVYLGMAADFRRPGFAAQARAFLADATLERKHHERARAR